MSREDYIAVAARLLAIYLLFLVISGTPHAVVSLTTAAAHGMQLLAWFVTALVACLAVAALLWVFPLTLARKLLPVMKEPRSDTAVNGPLALSLGLVLLGIWFFANAVADGFYWLAFLARSAQLPGYSLDWTPDQTANLVATVVQLVLAIALMLGSEGIRRLVFRARFGKQAAPE